MSTPGKQIFPPLESIQHSQPQLNDEQQAEHDQSEADDQSPAQFRTSPSSQEQDTMSGSDSSAAGNDGIKAVEMGQPLEHGFEELMKEFEDILSRAESILTESQQIEAIGTRLNRLAIDQRSARNLHAPTATLHERRAASYDEIDKAIAGCLAADPEYHIHPTENADSDIRTFFRLRQVAERFAPYLILNPDVPVHELVHALEVMADEARALVLQQPLRYEIAQQTKELHQELRKVERIVGDEWEVIPGKAGVPGSWHSKVGDDEELLPGSVWKMVEGQWVNSEQEKQQIYKWKRTGVVREMRPALLLIPTHLRGRLKSFQAVALGLISDIIANLRLVTLVDCITSLLNNLAQVDEARHVTHADRDTADAVDVPGENAPGTAEPDHASLKISALRAKVMRAEALQIHRERLKDENMTAEDRWKENARNRKQRREEQLEKELRHRRSLPSDSPESGESQGASPATDEQETRQPDSELELAWNRVLEAQTWTEGDRVREWRDRPSDERLQLLIDMDETSRQNIHDESEEWDTVRMAAGMVWRRLSEMQHENRDFSFEAYQATLRAEQVAREVRTLEEDDNAESETTNPTRDFEIREGDHWQGRIRFAVGDDSEEREAEDDVADFEAEDSDSEDVRAELMRLQEENLPEEDGGISTQGLSNDPNRNRSATDRKAQRRWNTVGESSGSVGSTTSQESMQVDRERVPEERGEAEQSQKPGFARPSQCKQQ